MVDWPIGHSTNHSVEIYITRVDEMSRKILPAIICVTLISLLMVTIDDSEAYTGEEFTVDGVIYSLVSDSEVNVAGADSSVENVSIGKQVEYQGHTFTIGGLERGAFQSNQNIKTVSIDSSFDTIARDAFADCNSLTQVTLCNSVSTIDIGAFRGCTSLSNIEGTVKYVFASSFAGCTSLSSMPFVNTLVYIHDNAFRECTSLKEVTISQTVEGIGRAFEGCTSLESIVVSPLNDNYSSIQGILFDIEKQSIIYCPAQLRITEFTTPSNVKTIGMYSFSDSQWIQSVTIGSSVVTVEAGAFANCISLKEVAFASPSTSVGSDTFTNCTALQKVTLPEGLESISHYEFRGCSQLTSIDIPSSVHTINDYAFINCSSLKTFTIPDGCFIGNNILSGCHSLEDLYIGENVFGGDYSLSGVTPSRSITIPSDFSIPIYTFYRFTFYDENGEEMNISSFFADFYGHTYKGSNGTYYKDLTPQIDEDCTLVFLVDGQEYARYVVPQFTTFSLPTSPEKESTDQYTFRFSGWDGYDGNRIALSSQTYEATFEPQLRSYYITFIWDEGSSSTYLEYGKTIEAPSYVTGITGWEGFEEGMVVTGPATFTATYESENNDNQSDSSILLYVVAIVVMLLVIIALYIYNKKKL